MAMNLGVGRSGLRTRFARGWACITAVLAAFLAAASPAKAQESATATARAQAVIVANLSFFKVDDLNFGKIIPGTSAGTVVLSPAGIRTATGGVRLASGTQVKPAKFAGKGTFGQTVTVSVGANSSTLTRIGGGGTMTMDTFIIGGTPTAQLTTAPRSFRIGAATGIFQFPVGATLRVKANQAPGTYVGSFTITLNYQ